MHSLSREHLLEQLGSLYGSGMLKGESGRRSYATVAEGIPVTDSPLIDTVLDDPKDGATAEITVKRMSPGRR